MALVDEQRLTEIEEIANDRKRIGLPPKALLRAVCETLRAAWAEREEAVTLAKGWQDEHRKSEADVARWRHEAADADQLACVREQERDEAFAMVEAQINARRWATDQLIAERDAIAHQRDEYAEKCDYYREQVEKLRGLVGQYLESLEVAREQVRQLDERLVAVARQRDEYAEECGYCCAQVRQLREALEAVERIWGGLSEDQKVYRDSWSIARAVLEATK